MFNTSPYRPNWKVRVIATPSHKRLLRGGTRVEATAQVTVGPAVRGTTGAV
jgi:hypothetical protein